MQQKNVSALIIGWLANEVQKIEGSLDDDKHRGTKRYTSVFAEGVNSWKVF